MDQGFLVVEADYQTLAAACSLGEVEADRVVEIAVAPASVDR